MNITVVKDGEALSIALAGRLDGTTVQSVEEAFLKELAAGESRFVFDLERLDYVSSAGLRVMLLAAKKTRGVGGKLALFGLNENVREVFEISGFHKIFALFATRSEAAAFVSAP
ncbi:STAS domain-containing protein [Paenibacillus antri]|uniref:Anti-sigma factor antagonist n=1 Tax=Paenibacillus antri TaxID=2582848 RepID=A0A5R9GP49_9BACL|nr:STAS domain-containing protein [Paenibacillus antri]TLS53985.1 STAS domain-containing protein [Paenibacillus antri]